MSSDAPGSPWQKKLMCLLGQEILLTFIWDMKGSILEHYKDKGQTVYTATYSSVLKDKLKLAFTTKEEDCCKKMFSCATKMLTLVSQPQI
jgi:hypothetical protein